MLKLELSGAEAKTKQKSTRGSGRVPVMVWVYQLFLELPESGLDTDAISNILTWFIVTEELLSELAKPGRFSIRYLSQDWKNFLWPLQQRSAPPVKLD